MRQTAKQIPAGGGHGGAAGLYYTVADRTRWMQEGYPSRQDIYIINVSVWVCVSVFDRPWSDISIHSFSMTSHLQPHLFG